MPPLESPEQSGAGHGGPPADAALAILLVEDDALVRAMTGELLASMGHAVAEAADADDALSLLAARRFDLMITDLSLPGMPGDELAERVRAAHPALPIVFVSGHPEAAIRTQRPGFADASFLQKPYDEHTLAASIRAAAGR
ncbi:MAG: response regulator [Proteobacteria bacterium]|nr:response regulator [Pseudomonadota bacterium]